MRKFLRFLVAAPVVLAVWALATLGLAFSILLMPVGIGFVAFVGVAGMYAGSLGLGIKFVRGTLRD